MNTEAMKFENENVSVQATVSPGCIVKLSVIAHPKQASKSFQEAIQRVRKEVSIPGFRKGKAPDSLILSHYTKAVDQEWKECLLNNAFHEALALVPFAPLKATSQSIKSALNDVKTPKDEVKLSYEFECVPNAPAIDTAALKVESPSENEVSEKDVDDKIEQIKLSFATWEEVSGRSAQSGDFVRLNVDEIRDGVPHPDFEDQRFEIKDKKMSPWLQKLVIGLSVGESKEGMSTPDEALDFADEETKSTFEPSLFKVTLNAIETPTTPEINEDFAKRLGVQTMDEVRTNLKKQLERKAQVEKQEKQRQKIEEALCQNYSFDLPKSLIEKGKDEKSQERERKQMTLYYLMRRFNQENGVEVTNDDLNRELSQLLQQFPQEMLPQITKSLNEEIYTAILSEVVVRKGIDKLLEKIEK